jgi:hypothetical protein
MTTIITIADNKYWKPLVEGERARERIDAIRRELTNWGINPLPTHSPNATPLNPNHGPWQQVFFRNKTELEWWQQIRKNPWNGITVSDYDKKAMESQAHSWIRRIVDSTNAEAGRTNEYDSNVDRAKGNNYHQRGHYFIFYEDGNKEHWLALYPPFNDDELRDNHNHAVFILDFDKPVQKFVDVYTCIGCGADEPGYKVLHEHYDACHKNGVTNSHDSWDVIHKGKPFDYWAEQLYVNDLISNPSFSFSNLREPDDSRIMSKNHKHCLGNKNHPNDFHVWEGKTIQDSNNKTFEKAYGHISQEGTIQWRLARDIKNEEVWVQRRIPYHANKLWNKREFTNFADSDTYRQKAMSLAIGEVLQTKNYVIGDMGNINSWLEKPLKSRFWRLINVKRNSYLALEALIKQHLGGVDIAIIKGSASVNVLTSTTPIQIPTSTELEIIRRIWNQQVERFIREGKAREFYATHNPRTTMAYADFERNIDLLYQQLFNNLGFNQQVANIHQQTQVAQIVVNNP